MKQGESILYKKRKRRITTWCWIFLLPALIFYIFFQGYPIISGIYYSMLDWSGMTSNASFIGLANYKELFHDSLFFNAVKNSFLYMLMTVPLILIVSLALAYIFNSVIKKGVAIFRTAFFLPVITTTAIVGIIMMFIFGGNGAVNQVLKAFGASGTNWLGTKSTALVVVALVGCWKDSGTYMIYWLAALQSVSQDVYEAAAIDGAGKWKTFIYVVFPIIMPIGGVIATLCIINSLKVFDLVQTMTNGGPFYATDVAATYVYRTAFSGNGGIPRMGYACSAALSFGLIVICIGVIGNAVKKKIQKGA